jgi:hypothetical protein
VSRGQKPDTFVFIGLPPEGAGSITNLSCDVGAPQMCDVEVTFHTRYFEKEMCKGPYN